MMKRGIAIFLLSLLLIHYSGFYIFFSVRLISIRQEIRKKIKTLPDNQYEILQLAATDFKKYRTDENEIEWQGRMYDIGKMKMDQGRVVLHVIHDKAEDNLLSFLDEIIKRSEGDSRQVPSPVLDFISLIFVPSANIFQVATVAAPERCAVYQERLYSVTLRIDSPPPQVLS